LDENLIDLQFFPESGELVHGLSSKVGFKALDAFGNGTKLEGDIVDQNNTVITSFNSNSLGMGSFTLTNVDSTQTYYARVVQDSILAKNKFALPKVAASRRVLSVWEQDTIITIHAFPI